MSDDYFLHYLLGFKGQALIPRLEGVTCAVGFRIQNGKSTSEYSLLLRNGTIEQVERGKIDAAEVQYTTSKDTFIRIVAGRLRAERAFLAGKVSIHGNILRGLKLAFLLQEFFNRYPYQPLRAVSRDPSVTQDEEEEFEFSESLVEERVEMPRLGLSVKTVYAEEGPIRKRVILAPPHPYLGGSSDNALLLRLSEDLALRGAFVTRFDYREILPAQHEQGGGVRSFWDSSDAGFRMGVEELRSIHSWLISQQFDGAPGCTWIGYSYGAQVCLWAQKNCSPDEQILLSPVASQLGAETLSCDCPTLLLFGTEDFATPTEDFRMLEKSFPSGVFLKEVAGADHFYSGYEEELVDAILDFLSLEPLSSPLTANGVNL